MQSIAMPPKFPIPFANNAGGSFTNPIPQASQINVAPGRASLTDGFPPLTFQPIASGGIPPFGSDMNGLLNQITAWCQWMSAGGPMYFDAAFAGQIGGYPKGATVQSALVLGNYWLSTADNNTTDPDSTSAANWINPPGLLGTAALGYSVLTTLPPGWVWAKNNYTIGKVGSGGSYAAPDTAFLYNILWNNFPNSQCPIYTSAGVSTTRGANAAADFAALKQLQVLDMAGTGIIGQANATGRLTGVPVISGNANTPGALVGENLHGLIASELPPHSHNGSGTTGLMNASNPHSHGVNGGVYGGTSSIARPQTTVSDGFVPIGVTAIGINSTDINHGHAYSFTTDGGNGLSSGPHNTVDRSMTVNWLLKL